MKPFNRGQEWAGASGVYNNVWVQALNLVNGCFGIFEDEQILHFFCAVYQIIWEIRQPVFVWYFWNFSSQAAQVRFLFNNECSASNLSGSACSLKACSPCSNDNNIALALHMFLFVIFASVHPRVNGAADWAVNAYPMPSAANVAGNAFADILHIPELHLVYPFRVSN